MTAAVSPSLQSLRNISTRSRLHDSPRMLTAPLSSGAIRRAAAVQDRVKGFAYTAPGRSRDWVATVTVYVL